MKRQRCDQWLRRETREPGSWVVYVQCRQWLAKIVDIGWEQIANGLEYWSEEETH